MCGYHFASARAASINWSCVQTLRMCVRLLAPLPISRLCRYHAVVHLTESKIQNDFAPIPLTMSIEQWLLLYVPKAPKHTCFREPFRHAIYCKKQGWTNSFFTIPCWLRTMVKWQFVIVCSVMLTITAYWKWRSLFLCHCSSMCFVYFVRHLQFTAFVTRLEYYRSLCSVLFCCPLRFMSLVVISKGTLASQIADLLLYLMSFSTNPPGDITSQNEIEYA